jgi:DDE superfamily endonuclease
MAASISAIRCSAPVSSAAVCCRSNASVAPSGSCSSSVPGSPAASAMPANSRSRAAACQRARARSASSNSRVVLTRPTLSSPACRPALPVLACLRKGETFADPAAGSGAGTTTARRYASEAVDLLAARAPKLRRAVRGARRAGYARVVVDGTRIPAGRVARDRPCCPGRHKKHGMSLQVIASPGGSILRVSGALPGPVRDKRAGWTRGVPGGLEKAGLVALAGEGYRGSTRAKVPCKGKNKPGPQKEANRARAKPRAPGERAGAQLKARKILAKLRCCPSRTGKPARAIHVLQLRGA